MKFSNAISGEIVAFVLIISGLFTMTILQAVILGCVQGITAFIPVSSTGHVILLSNLFGIEDSLDLSFLIILHLGTLIAILSIYYRDIVRVFLELFRIFIELIRNLSSWIRKRSQPDSFTYKKVLTTQFSKFVTLLFISLIPTCIVAVLIRPMAKMISMNLLASAMGLFITALLLFVASFSPEGDKGPKDAKLIDAVLIGAFQGFAGFPGMSRLGLSTSAGFISGFTRKLVLKYTYLLAVPTILIAILADLPAMAVSVSTAGFASCIAALAASTITGFFALRFTRKLIRVNKSRGFSIYCILIGVVSIIVYLV